MDEPGTAPKAPSIRLLRKPRTILVALALAMVYFVGLYAWATSGTEDGHTSSFVLLFSFLVGGPAGAAALAVRICDPRGEAGEGSHAALALLIVLLILAGGIVFFQEGGVCTVMAAPIFIPAGVAAAIVTGKMCRRRGGRLYALALPLLPLLLFQAEQAIEPPLRSETVADTIIVDAPPKAVWKQLVEVRHIQARELGWTFTQNIAGVPKPLDARLDRHGVGGVRHVSWGGGIRFGEEITRWDEARHLAWRFRFADNSIPAAVERHIRVDSGYLSIDGGSYRLEPLPGGRTRLTLATRYRLATGMNGYAAWWGRILIGDFHRNVLKVISGRAGRAA